jgi:hypothetical protein
MSKNNLAKVLTTVDFGGRGPSPVRSKNEFKKILDEFSEFLADELSPATSEISKIADAQRIHIQKLVFTNLVDRFDYTLDKLLLALVTTQP